MWQNLWIGWGVSNRAAVVRVRADQLPETFPEASGEQAVDDGVDGRAEVEKDAGEDVDVLINVVHQVGPVTDGTPQEPLNVKGRPAESKYRHHD